MDLDEIKNAANNISTDDLENVEVGEEIESLGITFTVARITPTNLARRLFSVDLRAENYSFVFNPVSVESYELPEHVEWQPTKKRKNRNEQRYKEIYEKSKTKSSNELAEEYGLSYQMIRYAIKKAKSWENNG